MYEKPFIQYFLFSYVMYKVLYYGVYKSLFCLKKNRMVKRRTKRPRVWMRQMLTVSKLQMENETNRFEKIPIYRSL